MTPDDFIPAALAEIAACLRPLEPAAAVDYAPDTNYETLTADKVTVSPALAEAALSSKLAARGTLDEDVLTAEIVFAARLRPGEDPAARITRVGAAANALKRQTFAGGRVTEILYPAVCDPELLRRCHVFLGVLTVKIKRVG